VGSGLPEFGLEAVLPHNPREQRRTLLGTFVPGADARLAQQSK
jgi:hypothetical protein